MKQGKTLQELAIELDRRKHAKQDYLVDTNDLILSSDADKLILSSTQETHLVPNITDHTHSQIGTWADIPKKYYDKMRVQDPELLANNVNTWLQKKPVRRMVRTLDNTARAFLSDRYRRIDNDIIADMALKTLLQMPNVNLENVVSCDVTDRKLYIKVVFKSIVGYVKVGDEVDSGIVISNSEIGAGGFTVKPYIRRKVCDNGLIVDDASIKKAHIGSRLTGSGIITYQDDTIKADDKALMLELRDTIKASGDQESFNKYVDAMREATEGEAVKNPMKAVEALSNNIGLNQEESNSVLEHLIRDQDYSKWGMTNAVTRIANDYDDYDRATELEGLGGRVLNLSRKDWNVIAEAV